MQIYFDIVRWIGRGVGSADPVLPPLDSESGGIVAFRGLIIGGGVGVRGAILVEESVPVSGVDVEVCIELVTKSEVWEIVKVSFEVSVEKSTESRPVLLNSISCSENQMSNHASSCSRRKSRKRFR